MPTEQLPEAFADLCPWLEWSLATESERSAKRQASAFEDIQAFYDALLPRMDAVLTFLSDYPPNDNPQDVERLFHLSLSLAEVASAVENYGQASVVDGYDVARFVAVHDQV
jgi:hypothetical protein